MGHDRLLRERRARVPRNIEIKARVDDLPALQMRVKALADRGPLEIAQDDTFFACPGGRLKLRTFSASAGELIFYARPDVSGPKESRYLLSATAEPETLRSVLTAAYGTVGRVIKLRTLYLLGRTRVHLDRVEGLGDFLELEVVLHDDEPSAVGVAEAEALLERLGIGPDRLVSAAYVDLLAEAAVSLRP